MKFLNRFILGSAALVVFVPVSSAHFRLLKPASWIEEDKLVPARPRVLLIVAVMLTLAWIGWSQAPARTPITVKRITERLSVLKGAGGNIAVFTTPAGTLLVDSMSAPDWSMIQTALSGISGEPVRYVINTHHHADHIDNNDRLRAQGAKIGMHSNMRVHMLAQKRGGLPDVTFNDNLEIFLSDYRVEAKYVGRGHTDGDSVVYFPSERVLHAGDLFVSDGEIYIDTKNGGTIKNWPAAIREALRYDFDTVIPGHGDVVPRADLVRWVDTLTTLGQRIQAACQKGSEGASARLDLQGLNLKSLYLTPTFPMVCDEFR